MTEKDWSAALRASGGGTVIDVEVVPNASKPCFPVGYNPWRKRIQARVAAPPLAGVANEELVALVAETLRVPRGHVRVVDGATSRRKRVLVEGVAIDLVRTRMAELLR